MENKKTNDKCLSKAIEVITEDIPDKWENIASKHSAGSGDIASIKAKYPNDLKRQCREYLTNIWWQSEGPSATVEKICETLASCNLNKTRFDVETAAKKPKEYKRNKKRKIADEDSGQSSDEENNNPENLNFKNEFFAKVRKHTGEFLALEMLSKSAHDVHDAGIDQFNAIIQSRRPGCIKYESKFFSSADLKEFWRTYLKFRRMTNVTLSRASIEGAGLDDDDEVILVPRIDQSEYEYVLEQMVNREKSIYRTLSEGNLKKACSTGMYMKTWKSEIDICIQQFHHIQQEHKTNMKSCKAPPQQQSPDEKEEQELQQAIIQDYKSQNRILITSLERTQTELEKHEKYGRDKMMECMFLKENVYRLDEEKKNLLQIVKERETQLHDLQIKHGKNLFQEKMITRVICSEDYDACEPEEINFKKGDIIEVITFTDHSDRSSRRYHWWYGKCGEKLGAIPRQCVQALSQESVIQLTKTCTPEMKENIREGNNTSDKTEFIDTSNTKDKQSIINLTKMSDLNMTDNVDISVEPIKREISIEQIIKPVIQPRAFQHKQAGKHMIEKLSSLIYVQ